MIIIQVESGAAKREQQMARKRIVYGLAALGSDVVIAEKPTLGRHSLLKNLLIT